MIKIETFTVPTFYIYMQDALLMIGREWFSLEDKNYGKMIYHEWRDDEYTYINDFNVSVLSTCANIDN